MPAELMANYIPRKEVAKAAVSAKQPEVSESWNVIGA